MSTLDEDGGDRAGVSTAVRVGIFVAALMASVAVFMGREAFVVAVSAAMCVVLALTASNL